MMKSLIILFLLVTSLLAYGASNAPNGHEAMQLTAFLIIFLSGVASGGIIAGRGL